MIYSLYIFDRHCRCVYQHDCQRKQSGPLTPRTPRSSTFQFPLSALNSASSSVPPTNTTTVGMTSVIGGSVVGQSVNNNSGSVNSSVTVASTHQPSSVLSQQHPMGSQSGTVGTDSEEAKLVYGVVYSLRNLCGKLSKNKGSANFLAYRTSHYKLHHYRTLSGLRFVLLTDPAAEQQSELLHRIYSQCYVEYVIKNPLARVRGNVVDETGAVVVDDAAFPDEYEVECEKFRYVLNKFIRSLALYAS
ncbi:Sybindin-like protein [Syncephalis pseudoplumigaleata]|uniref:Trafficking protein particle complex subunit n=1 Tax=Syncephalis pseudoplumigaleata TaxID=1712513 RepID=A0A4P9YZ56_9FUNG|nr:Sybindin-like protein [Syncephalis pseudoplumigaleata]|eukprot:RKP24872.1 Sybindin-like protein [Syncephalis pseudoplumigaleata]